nr:MAG TPA: YopX protein [Caudoviricetes sp.]
MNREIKFRAWHKDLKKMFKIGQITLEKGTWNFEPNDRDFIGMSIPYQPSFVLMQYIGLHDKNGKEIYEGDILKSIQWNDIYLVKQIRTAYYLCRKGKNGFNKITTWNNAEKSEVIGNIYDNPELLGGE